LAVAYLTSSVPVSTSAPVALTSSPVFVPELVPVISEVKAKVPVPPGFIITAQAYDYFIKNSKLNEKIKEILSKIKDY